MRWNAIPEEAGLSKGTSPRKTVEQSWHEALEELWLRVALPFRADSTNYEDMLDAAEHVRELAMGLGAGDLVEKAEEYVELLRQKRATN